MKNIYEKHAFTAGAFWGIILSLWKDSISQDIREGEVMKTAGKNWSGRGFAPIAF
jgi:hypothetical protein